MLIYFAAPLFSQAERDYNLQLTGKLEERGFTVFLPQRDGVEINKPPYDDMGHEERGRAIFAIDRDKVLEADILLIILDGRVPDEGACVELGIAYSHKYLLKQPKLLVGLLTDIRARYFDAKLNPMIHSALDSLVYHEDNLIAALEAYRLTRGEGKQTS